MMTKMKGEKQTETQRSLGQVVLVNERGRNWEDAFFWVFFGDFWVFRFFWVFGGRGGKGAPHDYNDDATDGSFPILFEEEEEEEEEE